MTQASLSMRKIEEILRLKFQVGLSHRAIAKSCHVSSSTVSAYVTCAKAAGLSWPLPESAIDITGIHTLLLTLAPSLITPADYRLSAHPPQQEILKLNLLQDLGFRVIFWAETPVL